MAEDKGTEKERTLELRVAELEDKLSGMQVTEEEMQTFNKVSALMGGAPQAADAGTGSQVGLTPVPSQCIIQQCVQQCIVQQCIVQQCTVIRQCTIINQCTIIRQCSINPCTISQCTIVQQCQCINECAGGAPGGGLGGGGFGGLGS